jgi:hypothetical protein
MSADATTAADARRPSRTAEAAVAAPYRAIATLYNALLTGLLLVVATRRGPAAAGELMFRVYRRHHHETFLSSFEKLGLAGMPDAVACAAYHYLANSVGGVRVEFMPESERKAWVRFAHPRWVYQGPSICGIPLEVSRAMLLGWFAHNGVSLGNPRLGFVCTSEDMDGQYGLAGYFLEHDRDLAPEERLAFSPGERPPPFDPALTPTLDARTWPAERIEKANRNYAMAPVRLMLPALAEIFGQDDGAYLGRTAAKLIGLQYYEETASLLGIPGGGAASFARYLAAAAEAQGDACSVEVEGDGARVRQTTWRLTRGLPPVSRAVFDAWNGLWEGALLSHDRSLTLEVSARLDFGDPCFEWRIRPLG